VSCHASVSNKKMIIKKKIDELRIEHSVKYQWYWNCKPAVNVKGVRSVALLMKIPILHSFSVYDLRAKKLAIN